MAKDTILVIDDNRTFCNYLCSILESKGFHTRNAYSFKNAVELVRNAHVEDVVLCDLQLGDNKTGNDLLKWMNDNDIRNPFIIMTQYDQAVTAVEAMKLGGGELYPEGVAVRQTVSTDRGNNPSPRATEKENRKHTGKEEQGFSGGLSPCISVCSNRHFRAYSWCQWNREGTCCTQHLGKEQPIKQAIYPCGLWHIEQGTCRI